MRIRQTLQRSKKNVKGLMIAHKRSQRTGIYKPRQLTLRDSAANSQHYPAPSFPHTTHLSLVTESGLTGEDTQMLSIKRKEILKMQLLNCENISLQEGRHSIGTSWFYVSLIQATVTGEGGTSTEKMPPPDGSVGKQMVGAHFLIWLRMWEGWLWAMSPLEWWS